jgi:hypothetical protein
MNFELQQPNHLISLASSALIVSVDVNVWTATKQDRVISNEVTASKNASADAGKFTKNLLSSSPDHKALLNYRQTVYNWLQRSTYDWAGSMRLLPIINLERFKKEYEQHEKEFGELLDKFIIAYPQIISDAAFKQGDMFNRSEYPDTQEVRSKFRIKLHVSQVPASDFRTGGIATAIADDLKQHYERQTKDIIDAVMADATDRLIEIAERLQNACTEASADDDGKVRRKKIYDSTFTQAKEICETIRNFNLTNNTQLDAAVDQLSSALRDVTVEDLRESSYKRSEVRENLDEMLSKFKPIKTYA